MTAWRSTAGILCECNCGIEVEVEGSTLKRIRGDERHPASRGYTCNYPLRLDHYQNGRDRLSAPLRRRADGGFEEISWDAATGEIAHRLAVVRDAHGGERSSSTAAARATTSAAPTAAASCASCGPATGRCWRRCALPPPKGAVAAPRPSGRR
jgi:anaerobic selenocysteine-containing dehydrogenase